jgi:SET domain-containing protein
MYVKSVEEKGYGVFANEFIPSDEIVGDYLGILTTTVYEDYKYSWSYLPSNSSYWDTPHEDLLLDGNFYGDGWLR